MSITATPVQIGTRAGSGSASTFTPTLASLATAGNLLLLYGCVTVAGRTASATGFTQIQHVSSGGDFSAHVFYKIANGTEVAGAVVLSGTGGGYYNISEWSISGLDASTPLDTSSDNETNIATVVTSQSSGSATNSTADALAFVFFGTDISGNVDAGRAYSNSYTERDTSDTANTSRGGYYLANKVLSSAASQTSTYTTTDTGDSMYGAIIIFKAAASGAVAIDPADLAQAETTGSPALVQHHLLTVAGLAEAETVGSPALTQHHLLVRANLDQAQPLSSLALTQHHMLPADSLTQAQPLSSPTLTPRFPLPADSLGQAQPLSSPVLTQHHLLAEDNLSQAQTLNSPVIVQHYSLSVAGVNQIQNVDADPLRPRYIFRARQLWKYPDMLGTVSVRSTLRGTLRRR